MINAIDTNDKVNKKVKVAIIDSGVDWGNDINLADSISFVPGEETINPLFMDGTGHGNSVAGLVAAKDNNKGITGINPNAEIYSIRVLDDNNEAPVSRVIQGINYAIEQQVDIINLSFGMKDYSATLKSVIDNAVQNDILVVAAAGNTGSQVEFPAAYENVLSVGAVNSRAEISKDSAKGNKVDIVAPGENVCSTGDLGDMLISSGKSLAAPQVSAVASLIIQNNPDASAELVKTVLVESANTITDDYVLLDKENALNSYAKIKKQVKRGKTINIDNNTKVETFNDTGCIKGSWSGSIHEGFVGAGHSNVKKGARYPDQLSCMKNLGDNPWWHGGYKTNYIAAYIYATRIAEQLGKGNSASNASTVSGLSSNTKNNMLADVKNINWSSVGMTTNAKKRAFMWGISMHIAADIFAHSAFIYSPSQGKWCHLAHGGTYNGKTINNYADNTGKFEGRFYGAEDAVSKILTKFDKANGAGSYKQFSGIGCSKKEYRLRDFVTNIKSTTSDSISTPYTNYNISSTTNSGILEYWWEG